MDKSVQVINIVPAQANGKVNTGPANEQGGENTTFSTVLAPAQADAAAATTRQATATDGNALPAASVATQQGVSQEEQAALLTLLTDTETGEADTETADQPVVTADAGTPVPVASPLQAVITAAADATGTRPAGTGQAATAAANPQQQSPLPVAVQAVLTGSRESTTAPVVTASEAVISETAARPAPANTAQLATTTEPGGQAVRAAVQEILAAQTGRGSQGQQSLTGNEQGAVILNSSIPTQVHDAAATTFSSIMGETTTVHTTGRIAVPVGVPGWGRALGEQVAWHVSRNIQSASLRLNPQHLGPMDMQVSMDGDRATIAFASSHAVVRDALESALPRLREMFSQNGINLVDVNVSQQDTAGRGETGQDGTESQVVAGGEEAFTGQDAQVVTGRRVTQSVGLFDGYA